MISVGCRVTSDHLHNEAGASRLETKGEGLFDHRCQSRACADDGLDENNGLVFFFPAAVHLKLFLWSF